MSEADADPGRSAPLDIIAESLRRERDRAGVSLSELAKRAGVAKSTLSQLEAGSGNPSIETLWALGVALGVPFSRLVDPPTPQVRVIRSGQASLVRSEQSPFAAALLSACPSGARRDLHLLTLEPGGVRHATAHLPGTVEHTIVTAGRMRTGPEENPVELGPGDYVSFSGNVPHLYEALEPGTTAVLVMEHA
ncbi:XRE family transcriptional regulator [Halopolyspora algeriensis]|uniref:XRE family transcriptional regulator n=1 Tax=Halopolyspora algeriensis TaxID=1500506 RepID=A0A368VUZ9_9ACTN|nr:XRE family transcriptional regulator [Halopolyspora algeriensis]RCW43916.1 XRE family transcriptional regulator [Halopolyspora algeriensis]TQM53581.1 XRE family transcriptional regulator [Halopolyspora algeriensis]